jgi:peptidoglycan-associated lipoprotein
MKSRGRLVVNLSTARGRRPRRHAREGAVGDSARPARLRSVVRVVAVAALASSPLLGGGVTASAQLPSSAPAGAASPGPRVVLAQAPTTPAAPAAPEQPIGLPRLKDYEPTPELRDVHFDSGAVAIRPDDLKILDANAAWLRANPDVLVLIEGHCDNRGATSRKNELNLDLGERRAQAAMDHLVARGVHPSRITILSYGEERPQCAEASERCWGRNRRSSFLVKPR